MLERLGRALFGEGRLEDALVVLDDARAIGEEIHDTALSAAVEHTVTAVDGNGRSKPKSKAQKSD